MVVQAEEGPPSFTRVVQRLVEGHTVKKTCIWGISKKVIREKLNRKEMQRAREAPLLDEIKGVNIINPFQFLHKSIYLKSWYSICLSIPFPFSSYFVFVFYFIIHFSHLADELSIKLEFRHNLWGRIFLHDVGKTGKMQIRGICRIVRKKTKPSHQYAAMPWPFKETIMFIQDT